MVKFLKMMFIKFLSIVNPVEIVVMVLNRKILSRFLIISFSPFERL